MVPGIEDRLMGDCSHEDVGHIAELYVLLVTVNSSINCEKRQKGASSARLDDTKSLKGVVLNWITPRGQNLNPPLARNVKINRGFHHECTGALLCLADLDWANSESVSPL